MTLVCPNCKSTIPRENINLRSGDADCTRCDFEFSLSAYELRRLRPPSVKPPRPKPPQPKPKHIKIVADSEKQLKFGFRWFRWFNLIQLFVGVAYLYGLGYLIPQVGEIFRGIIQEPAGFFLTLLILFFGLFMLLALLGFGLMIAYYALAGFINRTLITADHQTFSIHHGLLPTRSNYVIDASQLDQFYVFRSTTSRKGVESSFYDLMVILRNGEQKNLLRKVTAEHAWYIEQKLEEFYRLTDRSVSHEYRGVP